MSNDECLKNDEARMTNRYGSGSLFVRLVKDHSCFVIRHSLDIRH